MDWRPGRMWLALGIGLAVISVADAISSVQALEHTHDRAIYDSAWAGAAVLVAYAAWQPYPGRLERREVTGWRAIALALAAQVLAISLQIYAFFHEVPRSERILTVIVLVIATIQIVISRPRPRSDSPPEWDPPGLRAPVINPNRPGGFEANNAAAKANQLTERNIAPVQSYRPSRWSFCNVIPAKNVGGPIFS